MRTACRLFGSLLILASLLSAQFAKDAVRPFWGLGSPGSRAAGLGEAFTGIADDATALYYNPAGLGHLDQAEFNLGLNHLRVSTELQAVNGDFTSDISATRLGNLVMAFPVPEAKLTVAGGYHVARAFERDWQYSTLVPTPHTIDSLEQVTEQGQLATWSIGLGQQLTTTLAIGGAIDFINGENLYTGRTTYYQNGVLDYVDVLEIKPRYKGIGVSMGILMALTPSWRIGILLRSPWGINIEEESRFNDNGWVVRKYKSRSTFSFRIGSSLALGPLLIAGDMHWFDYSQIQFESELNYYGTNIPIDPDINAALRKEYLGTMGYALGAEYLLPGINLKLRAGYRHHPPISRIAPDDYVRHTFALGASLVPVPQLKLDTVYTLAAWQRNYLITENNIAGTLATNLIFRF